MNISPTVAVLAALAFALPTTASVAAPTARLDSHQAYTAALIELLSQTEICLNLCRDAASCDAALPRLRELSARAAELSAALPLLTEPTVQDYMASHPQVPVFNKLWTAIGEHIERLTQAGLMNDEMRKLLGIAPPEKPEP